MSLARSALVASVAAAATYQIVCRGGAKSLQRNNFRGDPVTLAEGPAAIVGLATGAHGVPVAALTAIGSGALGLLDDVRGSGDRRGLGGHLRALAGGEVTTGSLKVLGLGAIALTAALATDRGVVRPVSTAAATVVIAGSANLINLFDLRPGRALKVATLCALPLAPTQPQLAGAVIGSVAALSANDLAGRSMMGDTGANPLGAVLGVALVRATGPRGRLVAAATVTCLTLASERVSFSAFIASRPLLRTLDEWGRRS
ncbi:hypothetical protein [Calidifontibacter terrae]